MNEPTRVYKRKGMRPTTVAGFLVLAGVGIGYLLSTILPELPFGFGNGWNGFGNPAGTGSAEEKSASDDKSAKAKAASEQPEAVVETTETETSESETATGTEIVEAPNVVFVLINGRDYLLRRGPEDKVAQKPASLDEVVQAVSEATGDDNGVRVRISETATARTSALQALMQELKAAKIPRTAIRTKEEPIWE